jgi:hypothetical protein
LPAERTAGYSRLGHEARGRGGFGDAGLLPRRGTRWRPLAVPEVGVGRVGPRDVLLLDPAAPEQGVEGQGGQAPGK